MKVTLHIGLTFAMGPASSNQYGRLDITFSDIDPKLPLEEQLKAGRTAAIKAFRVAVEEIDREAGIVMGK